MNKLFATVSALALLASFADAAPISTYPPATTPLTGTEASIGTQGTSTVQISAADIEQFTWSNVSGDCTIGNTGIIVCTSTAGNATITGNLAVLQTANITGNLTASAADITGQLVVGGPLYVDITGSIQCLDVNSSGLVQGFGAPCGGAPSSPANAVQYDNAGNFGGGPMLVVSSSQLQIGPANAASPTAMTVSTQSVGNGTSNTAGGNLTLAASAGTGTGAGGTLTIETAPAGSSGNVTNTEVAATTWGSNGGITQAGPTVAAANASALLITAPYYTSTNELPVLYMDPSSASCTGWANGVLIGGCSLSGSVNFLQFQDGSTVEFFVSTGGQVQANGGFVSNAVSSQAAFYAQDNGQIQWANGGVLTSVASNNLQIGPPDSAGPAGNLTFTAQSSITGNSNDTGANLIIEAGKSTGNVSGGNLELQTSPAGASGTTQNAAVTVFQVNADKTIQFGQTTTVGNLPGCDAGEKGAMALVTDARSSPTFLANLTGSSTKVSPALCNGSAWVAF